MKKIKKTVAADMNAGAEGGSRPSIKEEFRDNTAVATVYFALRAMVVGLLVLSVVNGNYEHTFYCALSFVLLLLPNFLERRLNIYLPSVLEIIIILFIFAAEILGEIRAFYVRFAFWDTMLHTINGFVCAAVGLSLVELLNRDERVRFSMSPLFLVLVAFCFSMTVGVIWEFIEYGVDSLFQMDMQKDTVVNSINSVLLDTTNTNTVVHISGITETVVNGSELNVGGYIDIGLIDTMKDLLVNFIGAVVFCTVGYLSLRKGKSSWLVTSLVPRKRKAKK